MKIKKSETLTLDSQIEIKKRKVDREEREEREIWETSRCRPKREEERERVCKTSLFCF